MISDQNWLRKVHALPPERQREVLDFIESLSQREAAAAEAPAPTLRNLWADLDVDLDAGTLDAVRREVWRKFPRGDLS